jgi:hypothetical protein
VTKDDFLRHAEAACLHSAELSAVREDESFADLAHAARQLRDAVTRCQVELFGAERGQVTALAGYVQVAASWLHASVIPPHETDASAAALATLQAATELLVALNHDYGDLPS